MSTVVREELIRDLKLQGIEIEKMRPSMKVAFDNCFSDEAIKRFRLRFHITNHPSDFYGWDKYKRAEYEMIAIINSVDNEKFNGDFFKLAADMVAGNKEVENLTEGQKERIKQLKKVMEDNKHDFESYQKFTGCK